MALVPLKLPPGVLRNGTQYGSQGRYYDANLIRWTEDGTLKPIGGWRERSEDTVDGAARACIAWKADDAATWLAIGTHTNLYVEDRAGVVYDITPASFTPGRADAVSGGGYGQGTYGTGTYGTPRSDVSEVQPASQWTLDTWGEFLIGVMAEDGVIVQWELDVGTEAAPVTNAPSCAALVVTPERIVFALGTTDPRTVSWCDQEDNEMWTPDPTNKAGDFPLQTAGALMCGKNVRGGTLLFTDIDVHLATYSGGTLVYGFERVETACGIVSRQAVQEVGGNAVWMGQNGFWFWNGFVKPLPCDVQDYVFTDINRAQISKTYAVRNSSDSEIEFRYCSASSNEIDRCVIWNYKGNYWNIGRVARTCGTDRGVFPYPIYVDEDGAVYEHEVGLSYAGDLPYAEGGPVEIGSGGNVVHCTKLIPDEKTSGEVTVTFYARFSPNGDQSEYGPYSLSDMTDVRFTGRQASLRATGAMLSDWRFGTPRLDVVVGGRR
jgi:hypothetical protein